MKITNFRAPYPPGEVIHRQPIPKSRGSLTTILDIDLTKLVPELDTTASDIVSHQRESLLSRKDLAQKTKDFRKLDDASKLAEFKSLLKGRLVKIVY